MERELQVLMHSASETYSQKTAGLQQPLVLLHLNWERLFSSAFIEIKIQSFNLVPCAALWPSLFLLSFLLNFFFKMVIDD